MVALSIVTLLPCLVPKRCQQGHLPSGDRPVCVGETRSKTKRVSGKQRRGAELASEPDVGAHLAVPVVVLALFHTLPLAADVQHPVVLDLDLEVLRLPHPGHVDHNLVRLGGLVAVHTRHGDHGHAVPVETEGDVLQDPERVS